jgi:hypothetical protein
MKDSIFPGETMRLSGHVTAVETDDKGCGWVRLSLRVHAGERLATECEAKVAIPTEAGDNPWLRKAERWKP